MGEVASSYVSIYPKISANFGRDIQSQISRQTTGAFGPVEDQSDESGKSSGKKFGMAFRTVVAPLLALKGISALADFVRSSVDDFSQLEDASAAAGVTFGDSMDLITSKANGAAQTLGISKQAYIDGAITMGTFGKSAGLTGTDLANFSNQLVQTAGDMASFRGTTPEEAIQAVGAALRGETEPIRKYGVRLDEAALRQEALRQGLVSTTKDALTPQSRVLAAQALILRQTTDAQGDFSRTSQSTANVAKTLAAEQANLSAEIGEKLAPAIVSAQKAGIGFLQWVEQNQAAIIPFVGTMGILTAAIIGFVAVAKGIEALKAARATLVDLGTAFQQMGIKAKIATVSAGAVGIALTALSIVYGVVAQKQADAQQAVEDFTAAIKADTGALGESTRAAIAKKLADEGVLNDAKALGISLSDLVDATLGQADAQDRVNGILKASEDVYNSTNHTLDAGTLAYNNMSAQVDRVRGAVAGTNDEVNKAVTNYRDMNEAVAQTTSSTATLMRATAHGTISMKDYADSIDKVYQKQLQLRGGHRAFEAAIDAATKAIKENGKTLDINTEKGRANQAALDDIAESGLSVVQSLRDAGASNRQVKSAMDESRSAFIKAATSMGMARDKAKELADKLGLIKSKDITVKVKVNTYLDGPQTIKVGSTGVARISLRAKGGPIPGYATSDYDDKVLLASGNALGVPGEWVIRRAAVRQYGEQAMAAINSGRALVKYANGGQIGPSPSSSAPLVDYELLADAMVGAMAARGVSIAVLTDRVTARQRRWREMG